MTLNLWLDVYLIGFGLTLAVLLLIARGLNVPDGERRHGWPAAAVIMAALWPLFWTAGVAMTVTRAIRGTTAGLPVRGAE